MHAWTENSQSARPVLKLRNKKDKSEHQTNGAATVTVHCRMSPPLPAFKLIVWSLPATTQSCLHVLFACCLHLHIITHWASVSEITDMVTGMTWITGTCISCRKCVWSLTAKIKWWSLMLKCIPLHCWKRLKKYLNILTIDRFLWLEVCRSNSWPKNTWKRECATRAIVSVWNLPLKYKQRVYLSYDSITHQSIT